MRQRMTDLVVVVLAVLFVAAAVIFALARA